MPQDKTHTVQRGDCISSIAEREGFFWKTIWDQNSRLKSRRQNPNVLMPGDEVLIPEKRTKLHDGATEQRHRFVKKGTPAKLRLILERDDRPIQNARYVLTVDGRIIEGTTDDRGFLEVSINPAAARGWIAWAITCANRARRDRESMAPITEERSMPFFASRPITGLLARDPPGGCRCAANGPKTQRLNIEATSPNTTTT